MPSLLKTCATLFSGGGLADVGLKRAGLTPLWAVEYDADIASVYAANHGDHIIVSDVRHVDFATLPAPWLLWASPPCPNFSVAKTGRGETETDLEIADAVVRAIETLRPEAFILENVRGYADSQSYRHIRAALDKLDYWSDAEVVNSADLGTPQTRERLILRARAGGWMQPHRPWPAPVAWRGWYAAIEDLLPTLPDSAFAPWQIARLPGEIRESVITAGTDLRNDGVHRTAAELVFTVTTGIAKGMPRAFILDGTPNPNGTPTARDGEAPCFNVTAGLGGRRAARAWLVPEQNASRPPDLYPTERPAMTLTTYSTKHPAPKALLPPGRVVALIPRCLARFQGLPDSYWLPEKKSLACRVIGNGVAVQVAEAAARSLL
jgi:DNA (cytosine-5)-methyltransferase 1